MGRVYRLTRSGGTYQVTIPKKIAMQWIRRGVVGVDIEWAPPSLLMTPVTQQGLQYLRVKWTPEGEAHGDRRHKP